MKNKRYFSHVFVFFIVIISLILTIIYSKDSHEKEIKKALSRQNIAQIELITTGLSDSKIYKVFTSDNKIFIARFLSSKRNIKEIKFEINLMIETAKINISPKIIYYSDNYDLIIMDYVDGENYRETFFQDPLLKILAQNLKKLHSLSITQEAIKFNNTQKPINSSAKEYKNFFKKFNDLEKDFLANSTLAITHNDLHPGNMIADKKNVWIIDWQDAGIYGPMFDVARVSVELGLPLKPKEEKEFLDEYFGKDMNNLEQLNYQKALALALMKIIDSLLYEYTKDLSGEQTDKIIKNIFDKSISLDKIQQPPQDKEMHLVFLLQKLDEILIAINNIH